MTTRWLVPLLFACHAPPPATAQLEAVKIERVPGLDLPAVAGARHDCRLSKSLRARFPRVAVRPCGALARDATPDQRAAARGCVATSIEHAEPFLIEQRLPDDPGIVAHALIGIAGEHGLEIVRAEYDEPPCVGDPVMHACPKVRNYRAVICRGAALRSCTDDLAACVTCASEEPLDECTAFEERPSR